ncbi:MAG: NADH-quinone oxidoreductase subunit L [Actinomycetota bacterium]|nr:NADH-quinone oxidoreductase subunit L [Actinomycetota bacterium]
MLNHAWLIAAFPYASFFLILFFGKRLAGKGAEIGIAAIAGSLIVSIPVFFQTIANIAASPKYAGFERSITWLTFGKGKTLQLGVHVDGLTAVMLLVVCFVSLMVHIYSTAYMKGEVRYTFYFAALSLFTGSMLNLVLANNLLQMLVGWEGVGVCSYFLIGHYWEERPNSNAAIKAFITTRIGDVGFMFGIFVLFFAAKTFNIQAITRIVEHGGIAKPTLTVAAVLLFCGAIGKSAQVPLHVWLPDAMAGPTPVSALIHAATMVVAGVYLVARMYGVFHASPFALNEVAIIGAITMLIAALLALVQDDIKRVLAYSTISQLAYMVAALGVGAYTGGVFHIWTHAWFKALLFLGAGSVIHAVHSNNMSDMGGLRTKMPITYRTYMIGGIALAGLPPLAGFWSKDEILLGAFELGKHGSSVGWFVFLVMLVTAFLTACYVARMLALTFFGKPKYDESHVHPHESPPAMTVPLVLLAILAIVGGWVGLPGGANQFGRWVHFGEEAAKFNVGIAILSTIIALAGFATGWAIFRLGKTKIDVKAGSFGWFYKMLENKYYLDDFYMGTIVRPIRDQLSKFAYWTNQRVLDGIVNSAGAAMVGLGKMTYKNVDQTVIDGAVNGAGWATSRFGSKVRMWQSGNIQLYAAALFIGIAASVGVFLWLRG